MENESYQLNGFKYFSDKLGVDNFQYKIEHSKSFPEKLYKYYSLSKYSVDALIKGYFYASHPYELNDVLDASEKLIYTSQKIPFELYKKFFQDTLGSDSELEKFRQSDIKNNNCREYLEILWQVTTNGLGIISLTSNDMDNLMWPHYTGETGFQIKFSANKVCDSLDKNLSKEGDFYHGVYPINYSSLLEVIDASNYSSLAVPALYITNIKEEMWSYENEWRILISKKNMGVPYSKLSFPPAKDNRAPKENRYAFYSNDLIEEISLGANFFNGNSFSRKTLGLNQIEIKLLETDNWFYSEQKKILEYLCQNFRDKLSILSTEHKNLKNNTRQLLRKKEPLEIEQTKNDTFKISLTKSRTSNS